MIETRYLTQKGMHSVHPIEYKTAMKPKTVGDILVFIEKRSNDETLTVSQATKENIELLANQLHKKGWHQCNNGPAIDRGTRFVKAAEGAPTAGYYEKKFTPDKSNDVLCHVVKISKSTGEWGPWQVDVNTIYVNRHQFPTLFHT